VCLRVCVCVCLCVCTYVSSCLNVRLHVCVQCFGCGEQDACSCHCLGQELSAYNAHRSLSSSCGTSPPKNCGPGTKCWGRGHPLQMALHGGQ